MDIATNLPSGARVTNPVWAGIRMFFADSGFSSIVGLVLGFIVGFAGFLSTAEAAAGLAATVGIIVGLLISLYVSFVLYRKYSQAVTALVSMTATGVILSLAGMYVVWTSGMADLTQSWLILGAQIVVYVLGWYIAKTYASFTVWLPGNKTVWVFAIIGIISAALGLIAALGTML